METIEIDDELYAFLCSQIKDFRDTPNTILRRLLDIPGPGEHPQRPPSPRHPAHAKTPAEDDQEEPNEQTPSDDLRPEEESAFGNSPIQERPPSTPPSAVVEYLQTRAFPRHRPALSRFLALLSWLHKRHPQDFTAVASVRGRRRIYFAETTEAILRSGSSTKPQRIPETSWFVATNTSTRLKQVILKKVMARLHYDSDSIKEAVTSLA